MAGHGQRPHRHGLGQGRRFPAMAKGYPALPETQVLPECFACGSRRFRDEGATLRCDDCGVRQRDPFEP